MGRDVTVVPFPKAPLVRASDEQAVDHGQQAALTVQIKSWTWLALKDRGVEWTEQVLLSELSLVRARKNLGETKK